MIWWSNSTGRRNCFLHVNSTSRQLSSHTAHVALICVFPSFRLKPQRLSDLSSKYNMQFPISQVYCNSDQLIFNGSVHRKTCTDRIYILIMPVSAIYPCPFPFTLHDHHFTFLNIALHVICWLTRSKGRTSCLSIFPDAWLNLFAVISVKFCASGPTRKCSKAFYC
jgi:hypothetical protein